MKLGALKSAIRDHKGPVLAWSAVLDSWVAQQQGSFLAALDHRFNRQRNAETGYKIEDTGRIVKDIDPEDD